MVIRIVRVDTAEERKEQYRQALRHELDYELACLHQAKQVNNASEVRRSKQRLYEIHGALNDDVMLSEDARKQYARPKKERSNASWTE